MIKKGHAAGRYTTSDFVLSAVTAWLFASTVLLLMHFESIETILRNIASIPVSEVLPPVAGISLFLFVLFSETIILMRKGRKVVSFLLLVIYVLFASLLASNAPKGDINIAFLAILLLFLVPIVLLRVPDKEKDEEECPEVFHLPPVILFAFLFVLLFGGVVAFISVLRYLGYSTPNFDFGIFCQMFRNMKEYGVPNTTCERDKLLSHFAVHFAPCLYILLPFYFFFPSPVTIAIGQVVILYSGIIPLILLAKKKGLGTKATVFLSLAFCAYPAIGTGCFYDFHENCFMLPFLLWVFWFSESNLKVGFYISLLLTLGVKEDSFIYLVVFGIWLIFGNKKAKRGILTVLLSLLYFVVVSKLMEKYGAGVMSWRYSNMIDGEGGLIGVLVTVFTNPGYTLTQLLSTTAGTGGKIGYLLSLMMPLGFLPFLTKKVSDWILMVPILLNLLTMYVYQYNIGFQYSFGIIAFLFFLSVINLSKMKKRERNGRLLYSATAGIIAFSMLVFPMVSANLDHCEIYKDRNNQMEEVLQSIPAGASVTASTLLVPHLADRDKLYETTYHTQSGRLKADTDYIIFDIRNGISSEIESQIKIVQKAGYIEQVHIDWVVIVYVSRTYNSK